MTATTDSRRPDDSDDDMTGPWVLVLGTLLVGVVAVGVETVRHLRRRDGRSAGDDDRADTGESGDVENADDPGVR